MERSVGGTVQVEAPQMAVATVCETLVDGDVVITLRDEPTKSLRCSILTPVGSSLRIPPVGAVVLIWIDDRAGRGVVLGSLTTPPAHDDRQDELLIEARQSLTLRVGDGSITIRADGKILIKRNELVSHAQNVNRVKGGAVAIN